MKYMVIIILLLALPAYAMDENQQAIPALTKEIQQLDNQIESLEKQDAPQKYLDDLYAQRAAKSAILDARTKYLESLD